MQLLEALKQIKTARGFMDEDTIPAITLDKAIELLEQPFMLGDRDTHGQAIYGCVDKDDCKENGVPVGEIEAYARAIAEVIDGDTHYNAAASIGYGPND